MKTVFLASVLSFSFLDVSAQDFATGEIYDTVTCISSKEQSYSLYLPSEYNSTQKKLPVLYIFEPAARGAYATKIFQPVAEEYGYIIIASNNSRNGSWDVVFDAAEAMFQDSFERFRIDTSRIYLTGFSGGSRAAITVASLTNRVAGVIGCGAGFSLSINHQPKSNSNFIYYGLIGTRDMNHLEMKNVKQSLNQLKIKNRIHVFDGPHRWPHESDLRYAFDWLEIAGGYKEVDLKSKNMWTGRADSLFNTEEYLLYETDALDIQKFSAGDGLFHSTLDSLRGSKAYQSEFKSLKKWTKKEEELRSVYLQALTEMAYSKLAASDSTLKDMIWWHNEVKRLKKYEKSKDLYKSRMASRLLNMIWASCAEGLWNYVQQGDLTTAINLTELWVYIMPEQLWSNYTAARVYAIKKDKKNTLKHLEKSIELGFIPTQQMVDNSNFEFIQDTDTYKKLVQNNSY